MEENKANGGAKLREIIFHVFVRPHCKYRLLGTNILKDFYQIYYLSKKNKMYYVRSGNQDIYENKKKSRTL